MQRFVVPLTVQVVAVQQAAASQDDSPEHSTVHASPEHSTEPAQASTDEQAIFVICAELPTPESHAPWPHVMSQLLPEHVTRSRQASTFWHPMVHDSVALH